MLSVSTLVLALGLLSQQVAAQITFDPSLCRAGSGVSFSACNSVSSQVDYCGGPSVSRGAPAVSCYCNQNVFNGFFDCESELRRCFGNANDDPFLQSAIYTWHSACDPKITFTPTTPVVANITNTVDYGFCTTAYSACMSGNQLVSQCSLSHTDLGTEFSSCFCRPQILSLEYTCNFLGNTSCNGLPATLSKIPAYTFCKNAPSVLGALTSQITGPAVTSASVTGILSSSSQLSSAMASGTSSITRPTLPGSSSNNPTPSSTSSRTSSGSRTYAITQNVGVLFGLLMIYRLIFYIS